MLTNNTKKVICIESFDFEYGIYAEKVTLNFEKGKVYKCKPLLDKSNEIFGIEIELLQPSFFKCGKLISMDFDIYDIKYIINFEDATIQDRNLKFEKI